MFIHMMSSYAESVKERRKRVLHALDEEGMVACNPRDREAAHRAEVEGIATDRLEGVTCKKCRKLLAARSVPRRGDRAR